MYAAGVSVGMRMLCNVLCACRVSERVLGADDRMVGRGGGWLGGDNGEVTVQSGGEKLKITELIA